MKSIQNICAGSAVGHARVSGRVISRLAKLFILSAALVWPVIWSGAVMAAPIFQAAGTAKSGTGAVSPTWPAHQIGDLALLFVESAGGQVATLSAPAGFAAVLNSPQLTGTTTTGTRITVFWARATSTAMAAPTVADAGDHVNAQILTYRGVVNTGNPWDVAGGGVKTPASTSITLSSVTTTVSDTLIVQVAAKDLDSTAAGFSAQTNGGLTSIVERTDIGTKSGNGGGFAVWDGGQAVAGATGVTTVIVTSSINAYLTIALKPVPPMACFTDAFTGVDNAAPGANWSASSNSGTFGTPRIFNTAGNGRLRLTDASINAATFAVLQKQFPGAGNKIVVDFDHFAYGGTGADGIAVVLSDAAVLPAPGGYGGSLGYANRNAPLPVVDGFAGGWLGVGIDEYGNFSSPTEGRSGGAGLVIDSVSVRGSGLAQTGYAFHTGTATLNPQVDNNGAAVPPHRYRITIDHTNGVNAWVTVERNTGAGYVVLIPAYDAKIKAGQVPVPTNWLLSFTGSTGGSTNIHEIDNLSVCTTQAIAPYTPLHHIQIVHSGSALTCSPQTVTITACANAACTAPHYSGGVNVTLTPGGQTFAIDATGINNAATVQQSTVGGATLGATSAPAASGATTCLNTTVAGATPSAAACTNAITFADSGLLVSAPNHVAETVQSIAISAVRKSNNALNCVPAFANVSRAINMKCTYVNPVAGTLPVRVAGVALNAGNNAAAACDATGGSSILAFNASGTATVTLQYADVGQMALNATYTGSAVTKDAGLVMTGNGSFITAPASFAFSPITAPIKAGNAFSATVTALNAAGNVTPNFGKETPAQGVTLSHTLIQPTGSGASAGALAPPTFTAYTGGYTTATTSWSEVGLITLTATNSNYLGSGLTATGTSASVGAFIPDHFDTAVVATATVPMPCPTGLTCPTLYNGFIYSGQPFSEQVTARNLAGGTTANYHSAFGLSDDVNLSAWDALGSVTTQNPPGTGVLANATVPAAAFGSTCPKLPSGFEMGCALTSVPTYSLPSATTAPTDIYLRAVNAMSTVTSRRATPATSVEGGVKVVSGRVKVANAYGSELRPLTMTAMVQYYSSAGWVGSSTDNLTPFSTASIVPTIVKGPLTLADLSYTAVADACIGNVFCGGFKQFTLTNSVNSGGSASICLSSPAYLQGVCGSTLLNAGQATFGVYRANPVFIYRGRHGR